MKTIGRFRIQDWLFTCDEPAKEKDQQIILHIFCLLPGYSKTLKFQNLSQSSYQIAKQHESTMTPNLLE